jgi:sugar lactone lactonase YvrE
LSVKIYNDGPCELGEGAFWHPQLEQFFWFDITNSRLYTQRQNNTHDWAFAEKVSAAGWLSNDLLLIASETGLLQFNIVTGDTEKVCPLEANNPMTRSNDGRADPWGGFWISTMGKSAQIDAGAIYRYYQGELRKLYAPITIPNAICFSPDRCFAYFSDTAKQIIWRQPLAEKDGWPIGEPAPFIDCSAENLNPDGAVVDSKGFLWNAQWGASRIARYSVDGEFMSQVSFPTQHITCPAFGGGQLTTLFATSATQGLTSTQLNEQPEAGKTFMLEQNEVGQNEHQIIL